jgi:hypothetical protein
MENQPVQNSDEKIHPLELRFTTLTERFIAFKKLVAVSGAVLVICITAFGKIIL